MSEPKNTTKAPWINASGRTNEPLEAPESGDKPGEPEPDSDRDTK